MEAHHKRGLGMTIYEKRRRRRLLLLRLLLLLLLLLVVAIFQGVEHFSVDGNLFFFVVVVAVVGYHQLSKVHTSHFSGRKLLFSFLYIYVLHTWKNKNQEVFLWSIRIQSDDSGQRSTSSTWRIEGSSPLFCSYTKKRERERRERRR